MRRKNKFEETFEVIEGFCLIISVTDLNRPNTENENDINI
jgi:hypothetical protein